ncbi:unnamed protein product [Spodoptera exigua]|nr:unnamed protein product [Spodoptera exigua]
MIRWCSRRKCDRQRLNRYVRVTRPSTYRNEMLSFIMSSQYQSLKYQHHSQKLNMALADK